MIMAKKKTEENKNQVQKIDKQEIEKLTGEQPLANMKHELFVRKYLELRGNQTQAYCQAYDLDYHDPKDYSNAKSRGHELVKNSEVHARIKYFLKEIGLNDNFVDNELLNTIWQDEDKSAKVKAIDIYNKMSKRYENNINITIDTWKTKFG